MKRTLKAIGAYIQVIIGRIGDIIPDWANSAWKTVVSLFVSDFQGIRPNDKKALIEDICDMLGVHPDMKALFRDVKTDVPVLDMVIVLTSIMTSFYSMIDYALPVLKEDEYRELRAKHPNFLPEYMSVITGLFRDPALGAQVSSIIRESGISPEMQHVIEETARPILDTGTIFEMFFRGLKDEDWARNELSRIGYSTEDVENIWSIRHMIPSVQDIITMAVREAFTPEAIGKYGLYEAFPPLFADWAAKKGLTEDWAKAYWASHWQLPSMTAAYEMLHRGVATEEEIHDLLTYADILPYWHNKLIAIAYSPLTRVDVRRMHKAGVLRETEDHPEVTEAYRELGYNELNAGRMADFTVKYNTEDLKELTRTQIVDAYEEGILIREDTKVALNEIGYVDDDAEIILAMADYAIAKNVETLKINTVKAKYLGKVIDTSQARSELNKFVESAQRVETLIENWDVEAIAQSKIPSKTDLDKFAKANIISKSEYEKHMGLLGYDRKYIEWYWRLVQKALATTPEEEE
jgi:hypothetical protein